jgi:hypothetical protein
VWTVLFGSERDSVSGAVITEINIAGPRKSGVSAPGLAHKGNPVAPPAHRTNASGPLPLCVDWSRPR